MKKVKIPEWIQAVIFYFICFSLLFIPILIFAYIYDFINETIIKEKKIKIWYCKQFHKRHHNVWSYWNDNTIGYECSRCGVRFDTKESWIKFVVSS
jgi:hypothetical protein